MVTKKWMSRMLGCVLGAVVFWGASESSFADPPKGYAPHRGVVVSRNGFHYGNVNRYYVPHPPSHYHYGYGYGYPPYWGYPPNYHCQPIARIPSHGYYLPSNVGVGIGGWPSGPSFGGGGFPNGPSYGGYGGGVQVRIGR